MLSGYKYLITFLSGLLSSLAFAPLEWAPVLLFSLAFLFYFWQGSSARQAGWLGLSFGTGLFLGGVYWVYISMHDYGNIPSVFSAALTFLFALFMGLFPALAGWLSARFFNLKNTMVSVLVLPTVWTLLEWVRSWFFTGFPWMNTGVSQVEWPLSGFAPVGGEYLVSWLLALSAVLLVSLLHATLKQRLLTVVLISVIWLGGFALQYTDWSQPKGKPFSVALVQGNISQAIKWDPGYLQQIIDGYLEQTRPYWGKDVIIWPETAVSAFYHRVPDIIDKLEQTARKKGSSLLVGIPFRNLKTREYYNAVLSLGGKRQFYLKRHLVPFGEYIPFQKQLKNLLDLMGLPMSGFSSGADNQVALSAAGYLAGVTICYEIGFNSEVRASLPDAHFLVNVSNNTWFGDSFMPWQQLQMARMRAQETGRYVLSATNNGASGIVNHHGKIIAASPQFQPHVLTGEVQARTGMTPYVYLGNWPFISSMLLLLFVIRFRARLS